MAKPPKIVFIIQNLITEDVWAHTEWVKDLREAQVFPSFLAADKLLIKKNLEKILGAEVVQLRIEYSSVKKK